MAVFGASLYTDPEGCKISIRKLQGEDLCSFRMSRDGTLQDLEVKLLDQGPLSQHLSSPILNFFNGDVRSAVSEPLDLKLPVCDFKELLIKQVEVGLWLKKWPYTGSSFHRQTQSKFLEAMRDNKFMPGSPNFKVNWKAQTAREVQPREALKLVQDVLKDKTSHADSELHFVQIFGKLTALAEPWKMFDLAALQNYDPHMRLFKHSVCEHWLDLAGTMATSFVSKDVPPMYLFNALESSGWRGEQISVIGHSFPRCFTNGLQNTLRLNDMRPFFNWRRVAENMLFFEHEGSERYVEALKVDRPEPNEFPTLSDEEISQMVQVQLRLCCCGIAEVQGPLNEVCVRILADLLNYKLKILAFDDAMNLEGEIQQFESEILQDCGRYRGTMIMITSSPSSLRGNVFSGHRVILCYEA